MRRGIMDDGMSIKDKLEKKLVDDDNDSESLLSMKNGDPSDIDVTDGLEKRKERAENKVIKNMDICCSVGSHSIFDCFDEEICEIDGFDNKKKFRENVRDIVGMELSLLENTYDVPFKLWEVNSTFKKVIDDVTYRSTRDEFLVYSRTSRKAFELARYLFNCKEDEFEVESFGFLRYKDFVEGDDV